MKSDSPRRTADSKPSSRPHMLLLAAILSLASCADQPDRVVIPQCPPAAELPNLDLPTPGYFHEEMLGVLNPPADADEFDPSPAALDLASEADYVLANCRMLNQAVHGVPTAAPIGKRSTSPPEP